MSYLLNKTLILLENLTFVLSYREAIKIKTLKHNRGGEYNLYVFKSYCR